MEIKLLNEAALKKSLKMSDVLSIVENVYRQKSQKQAVVWDTIFYDFEPGKADMDIKSGYLKSEKIFGHKTVTWFGENTKKNLPTLTGLICIFDATTGFPIGMVDGAYITGMRTGAAGAIGAKYLANPEARKALIIGAGNQLKFQVAGLLTALLTLEKITIYDRDLHKAKTAVKELPATLIEMGILDHETKLVPAEELAKNVAESEVIITITPAKTPIIKKDWISPGTHLSCLGADMQGKQEIDAALFAQAQIFTDDLHHSSQVGEMEAALKQGIITMDEINGEIGEVLLRKIAGRASKESITIFDATGMALMDIATAKVAIDNSTSDATNTFEF